MDSKTKFVGRIDLGSLSADTRGPGGVILESFTYMPKIGISA
ncbi:MAG TPA: hypothetical protein VFO45_09360 [Sphingomicrobium sp.]|nr:hypothetical protein [Sphingomicrobium sp.]